MSLEHVDRCPVDGCDRRGVWTPEGCTRRLCQEHVDEWLRAERELDAEREEMRGRTAPAPMPLGWSGLFGVARIQDGRSPKSKRRPKRPKARRAA